MHRKRSVIFMPTAFSTITRITSSQPVINFITRFEHAQMMQILGQNFQSFLIVHCPQKLFFALLPFPFVFYLIILFFFLFVFFSSSTIVKTMVQHTGDSLSLLHDMEKRYKSALFSQPKQTNKIITESPTYLLNAANECFNVVD